MTQRVEIRQVKVAPLRVRQHERTALVDDQMAVVVAGEQRRERRLSVQSRPSPRHRNPGAPCSGSPASSAAESPNYSGLCGGDLDLSDLDMASVTFTHQADRNGQRVELKTDESKAGS
jgi:hypothetical protein